MSNQKTYTYQKGRRKYKFTAKPINLGLRRESFHLINAFKKYAKQFVTELSEDDAKRLTPKQKETALEHIQGELSAACISFLSDEATIKKLLETFLDGDLSVIDYSGKDDASYLELMSLGSEVLMDFFYTSGRHMTLSKK